jgi:formyl-CoA transferase/CoA:oxalate CoA-transferase
MDYRGPLTGVLVVDLTRVLAGPFATTQLVDLGAQVIKVEDVGAGDWPRTVPPMVNGVGAHFNSLNRDKLSIAIDLKHPEGRKQILKLVEQADVLIENFRPGVLKRLGLDYEQVSKVNPRIIVCSVSGFGQDSSVAERGAYDIIIQAESGIMSVNGDPDDAPTRVGLPLTDLSSGMFAALGVLAALYERERTGNGQTIDVSMLDTIAHMMIYYPVGILNAGETYQRMPKSRHGSSAPYGAFDVADGSLVVAVMTDVHWLPFCRAIEHIELADDPRFADAAARMVNQDALYEIVDDIMLPRTRAEWVERFNTEGVPHASVRSIPEMTEHPVLHEREMFVEVEHPVAGPLWVLGRAIKFPQRQAAPLGPAPLHGQHTREVLMRIAGATREEVLELEREGVLVQAPETGAVTAAVGGDA